MKKGLTLLTALAAMSAMSGQNRPHNDGSVCAGIPDKPKRVIPNGCKLYKFYGIEVVATSENKAREKARKRFWKQCKAS